jgi:hypothetical protein
MALGKWWIWVGVTVVGLGGSAGACSSDQKPGRGGGGTSAGTSAGEAPDLADAGSEQGGANAGDTVAGGASGSSRAGAGASGEGGLFDQPTPCGSSDECTAGRVCDQQVHLCVDCLLDADCGDGEHCRAFACKPRINCRDDGECPSGSHCDPLSFVCEECSVASDCGPGGECTASHLCVAHPTCSGSQACAAGMVCDQLGRCVECVYSADCGGDRKCLAGRCADGCTTDAQCAAPQGCDLDFSACVACLDDAGCPATHHCNYGKCELDDCVHHDRFCYSDGLYECAEDGTTRVKLSPCPVGCGLHGDSVSCNACTPGAVDCQSDHVVTCADDGSAFIPTMDCTLADGFCQAGQCEPRVCQPDQDSCVSRDLYHCNTNGSSLSVKEDCYGGEVCDAAQLACVPQLCEPNQYTCSENQQGNCDATGLGFTEPPVDCKTATCSLGGCLPDCTKSPASELLRFYEIGAGMIAVKNRGGCPADIAGLSLEIWLGGAKPSKAIWRLPAKSVPPQSTLTIVDAASTGDVTLASFSAALNASADRNIWLCVDPDGSTGNNQLSVCSEDTVIDIVVLGDAAPPLTGFGWEGLLDPDLTAGDFLGRELFTGNEPTYSASDWSIHHE